MFKRYGDVMLRLEELGARAGKLSNNDRHELQSLLEEQAWLGTTMVKKAKSVLEEIDGTFEKLFDWMIDISDLIERAAGEEGTPGDLLELEKMMADAVSLRDQMKRLNLNKRITRAVTRRDGHALREARKEAAPTVSIVHVEDPSMSAATLVGVDNPGQTPPEDSPLDDHESSMKLTAAPVYIEPQVVSPVPTRTGGPAQKKSRKKKVKKAKLFGDEQYQPPQELLTSMAEKMAPSAQRKYPAGLSGDAEHIIPLNIPRQKI